MNEDKKVRLMTPKGFLRKANTTKSALGFFEAYRDYMTTGDLAPLLSPIVAKVDSGELMPTPAQAEVARLTMVHVIAYDTYNAEKAILTASSPTVKATSRSNWVATCYDGDGNVCTKINKDGEEEDLVKGFEMSQDGQRWLDLRLFEGTAGWHGELAHTHSAVKEIILRQDSIARILKQGKKPVIKAHSKTTQKLGFGVKAKESRSTFSRG